MKLLNYILFRVENLIRKSLPNLFVQGLDGLLLGLFHLVLCGLELLGLFFGFGRSLFVLLTKLVDFVGVISLGLRDHTLQFLKLKKTKQKFNLQNREKQFIKMCTITTMNLLHSCVNYLLIRKEIYLYIFLWNSKK